MVLEGIRPRRMAMRVLACVVATSCAVTLISPYDQTTDQDVTALQKEVDGLLTRLNQDTVPAYANVKPAYDSIFDDFNSLLTRNEARDKNDLTLKQLAQLKTELDTLQSLSEAGRLTQPMLQPTRVILDETFGAILKLELEKKEEGKSP